uniref:Uncharacterized protein n=1 Tax=viral metagenome TaxID=1070528 RepID=A0A6C0JG17_9ZZZZ
MNSFNENFSDKNKALDQHSKEYKEFNVKKNWSHWLQVTTLCIIKFLITAIAAWLFWECNAKSNLILRVLMLGIVISFPEFYILYYAIYRTYLGNKCPI